MEAEEVQRSMNFHPPGLDLSEPRHLIPWIPRSLKH